MKRPHTKYDKSDLEIKEMIQNQMTKPKSSQSPKSLEDILEKLHEKLLIGWIHNDGKVHTIPSHTDNDGCTDEALASINQLVLDVIEGKPGGIVDYTSKQDTFAVGYGHAVRDITERWSKLKGGKL